MVCQRRILLLAAAVLTILGLGGASRAEDPNRWAWWCALSPGDCDEEHVERMAAAPRAAKAGPTSKQPALLPDRALLTPQPEPNCEFKGTGAGSEETLRVKLDFERQCYRHAEIIVRNRLRLLQDSVEETIKTAKRREQAGR